MAYTKTDRFGNSYVVVGCKDNKNGFPVGYERIGGKLYKFEPTRASGNAPEGKKPFSIWLRITEVDESAQKSSSFGRNRNAGGGGRGGRSGL